MQRDILMYDYDDISASLERTLSAFYRLLECIEYDLRRDKQDSLKDHAVAFTAAFPPYLDALHLIADSIFTVCEHTPEMPAERP